MPGFFDLSAFSGAGEEQSGTASLSFLLTFGEGQDQIRWNKRNGSWNLESNWDPSVVPKSEETAIFSVGEQYTVNVGQQTVKELRVGGVQAPKSRLTTQIYPLNQRCLMIPVSRSMRHSF